MTSAEGSLKGAKAVLIAGGVEMFSTGLVGVPSIVSDDGSREEASYHFLGRGSAWFGDKFGDIVCCGEEVVGHPSTWLPSL